MAQVTQEFILIFSVLACRNIRESGKDLFIARADFLNGTPTKQKLATILTLMGASPSAIDGLNPKLYDNSSYLYQTLVLLHTNPQLSFLADDDEYPKGGCDYDIHSLTTHAKLLSLSGKW